MKTTFFKQLSILLLALVIGFGAVGCEQLKKELGISDELATADEKMDVVEDFGASFAGSDEGAPEFWVSEDMPVSPAPGLDLVGRIFHFRKDTTFIRKGLTVTIDRTFFTLDSVPSEQYDSLTSAWVTRKVTVKGTYTGVNRTAKIDHIGQIKVQQIAPADTIHLFNGAGGRTVESSFKARWRNVQRTFKANHQWSMKNVHIYRDREAHPYPIDGSLSVNSVVKRTVTNNQGTTTKEILVSYTVTFDGSGYAKIDLLDGGTYWISLADGTTYEQKP